MHSIHPTALVDPRAALAPHVTIGPYAIVEAGASIGDGTTVSSHAFIGRDTTIGRNNAIHMGCVIGHEPQHKEARGVKSFLTVGDDNIFREYVTVHRGSTEGSVTRIGDHNYFMVNAHVGHDAEVRNHVVLTNGVLLGGHVVVQDFCVLGGGSAVHQFCRIGAYAMVGGLALVTKDLPPYMLVGADDNRVGSLNLVGLRRAGFSEAAKREIKNAYKLLYLSDLNVTQAVEAILKRCRSKEVLAFVEFIRESKRGILSHRRPSFDRLRRASEGEPRAQRQMDV